MNEDEGRVRAVSIALAEIARVLESMDAPHERVQRALELARPMIPFSRCAVLTTAPARWFVVTPATYGDETEVLRSRMTRALSVMTDAPHRPAPPREPGAGHLTVPVTSLDQVVGVLTVEPQPGHAFEAEELRLSTVVAAQIGAYLTMIRLRDEEVRSNRRLVAAQDFQQVLVGMVSHDLRNPLSVITVAATNLLRKANDPALARTVERTLRCAHRANRIIADLLDVSWARVNGEVEIAPKPVELDAHLEDLVAELRVTHASTPIVLEASGDPVHGEWDPERINQAVTNLVANAVQHADEEAPVKVSLSGGSRQVQISVTHTGAVIPPEDVETMLDPFAAGPNALRRPSTAVSLQLHIVKQIAEAHGGQLEWRSSEPQTTFTLVLPRQARRTADSRGVLVVDDDLDTRSAMVEALEAQGYRVATATNGERALEQLKRGLKPQVVLLDLHMPVMDGATLCTHVLEDPELKEIPLLILSSDRAAAAQLTRQGAAGFLPKPLQVESLLATVKRVTA
mgnify:CR=1 FL=1